MTKSQVNISTGHTFLLRLGAMNIGDIFKTNWFDQSVDERVTQVKSFDPDTDTEKLLAIVDSDEEDIVKAAAVERIRDYNTLQALLSDHTEGPLSSIIRDRMGCIVFENALISDTPDTIIPALEKSATILDFPVLLPAASTKDSYRSSKSHNNPKYYVR